MELMIYYFPNIVISYLLYNPYHEGMEDGKPDAELFSPIQ